jgi:hypothetical protein
MKLPCGLVNINYIAKRRNPPSNAKSKLVFPLPVGPTTKFILPFSKNSLSSITSLKSLLVACSEDQVNVARLKPITVSLDAKAAAAGASASRAFEDEAS